MTALHSADTHDASIIRIDATGQPCPMPLLFFKRALKQHDAAAQLFLLISSDPHSQVDVQRYCQLHGFACECRIISNQVFHYFIQT